ncbi:MAG TPA: methylated-DNA--[protein]-cysteine S-methyltransferase [Rhodanobacter sp.]|nr:methylated-DNA--[protein]-cysteine S-methyltransferase [Rhodanobacter sp.]
MNQPTDSIHYLDMASPVGVLRLVADNQGLREIRFEREARAEAVPPAWIHASKARMPPPIAIARQQLQEYFAGERQHFELALHPVGTPFQLGVWQQLRLIPYGITISYGELARRVGNPAASRAVGAANGRNPLPIVVPCHRVIGSNGSLTGFSGGLPIKQKLLALEQCTTSNDLFADQA